MKIGILGGSFNPPHQGHLHISLLAIKTLKLQQLWWIPTLYNNFKDRSIYQNYQNRFKMCQNITLKYRNKIKIVKKPEVKSYLLIKNLQKQHPNHRFTWIMGADSLINFHLWHQYQKLLQSVKIAVFSRNNLINKAKKSQAVFVAKKINANNQQKSNFNQKQIGSYHTKQINISSTQIRQENQKKILT